MLATIGMMATEPGRSAALSDTSRWYDDMLTQALVGWSPQELAEFTAMLQRFSSDVLSHLETRPAPTHNTLEAAR